MSKTLRIIVFILLSKFSQAQLAIGTNTIDASAKLQVDASNKGFLPPRVTLTGTTDISTISTPATGLLFLIRLQPEAVVPPLPRAIIFSRAVNGND